MCLFGWNGWCRQGPQPWWTCCHGVWCGNVVCSLCLVWSWCFAPLQQCSPVLSVWWIVPLASALSCAPFVFHWSQESAWLLVVLSGLAMWCNFLLVLHHGRFLLGETPPQHGSTARFVGCWVGWKLHWPLLLLPGVWCHLVFPDCCIQVKFSESCGLVLWCNDNGVSRGCYHGICSIIDGGLVFVEYRNGVCIGQFGDDDECRVQSRDYIHFSCPFP